MKTQHTPGPWVVAHDEVQLHGSTIAELTKENQWNTSAGIVTEVMPWKANAQLIAAAPELLDALKALMHAHASPEHAVLIDARLTARALIDRLTDQ